jgi:hypothetical protein
VRQARLRILACVLALSWPTADAFAHDPPLGTGVFRAGKRLLIRTNRGLISSADGVADFRLLCNEALGISTTEVPSILPRADGQWLIGTSRGLFLASDDLCSISTVAPLVSCPVPALAQDPAHAATIYASTSSTTAANDLYTSTDNGTTFAARGAQMQGAFYTHLLVSPVTAQRLFATLKRQRSDGKTFDVFFAISNDAGDSFSEVPFALGANEYAIDLLGAHPTSSNIVFGAAHAYLGTKYLDRLLVSTDSGSTWTNPLSLPTVDAFAVQATGGTMWLGSVAGLWRSNDNAQTFTQVQQHPIYCLSATDDQLYVCDGSSITGGLSVSNDQGETLTPIMRFSQVTGPAYCSETADVSRLCASAWSDWQRELTPTPVDAGAPDASVVSGDAAAGTGGSDASIDAAVAVLDAQASAPADAGTSPAQDASVRSPAAAHGGCSCDVASRATHDAPFETSALLCFGWLWLRRWRRADRVKLQDEC